MGRTFVSGERGEDGVMGFDCYICETTLMGPAWGEPALVVEDCVGNRVKLCDDCVRGACAEWGRRGVGSVLA